MPYPRFGHKKSRNGCLRCKARKVKCDEARPVCGSCRAHQVPCHYGTPQSQERPAASVSSNSSPCAIPTPYSAPEPPEEQTISTQDTLLELQLLHNFVTVVIYTFTSSKKGPRDLWSLDANNFSFRHSFLRNCIFAISALHLATTPHGDERIFDEDATDRPVPLIDTSRIPPDPEVCADAHRKYLNLAIRDQRKELAKIHADNAYALFLCAVLLTYQALKLLPEDWKVVSYRPPLQVLQITRAVSDVVNEAKGVLQYDHNLTTIYSTEEEKDLGNKSDIFTAENRRPFEALLDWSKHPEMNDNPETREAYEQAVMYVGMCYNAVREGAPSRTIFRYLVCLSAVVSGEFLTLVEQWRPRALAILAQHFALAKIIDDHWMIRGTAEREVQGIQSLLPPDWQFAMEFPLRFLQTGNLES